MTKTKFWILFTTTVLTIFVWAVYMKITNPEPPKEYQLKVNKNGYILYDHSKAIGFIPASNGTLDSLIINDNQ